MKFTALRTLTTEYPINLACRALKVSTSGYYAWLKRPESKRAQANRLLVDRIRVIFAQNKQRYGSPRIYRTLRAQGETVSEGTIARLMRKEGIVAQHKRSFKRTTQRDARLPVVDNHLQQDFTAHKPNQKWVADMTYLKTSEGWLYLAVILDVFSRKVIGWAMDTQMSSDLSAQALRMALLKRGSYEGTLHHSDRGSQYASSAYQQLLNVHGLQASMSGTGNCYDNALMESWFATLKTELGRHWASRAQATSEVFEYVEVYYNRERLHSSLDYQTPAQFEQAFYQRQQKELGSEQCPPN